MDDPKDTLPGWLTTDDPGAMISGLTGQQKAPYTPDIEYRPTISDEGVVVGQGTSIIQDIPPRTTPPEYIPRQAKSRPSKARNLRGAPATTTATTKDRDAARKRLSRAKAKSKSQAQDQDDDTRDIISSGIGGIDPEWLKMQEEEARQSPITRDELVRTLSRIIRSSHIPAEQVAAAKTLASIAPDLTAAKDDQNPDPAVLVAWLAGLHSGIKDPQAQLRYLGGPRRLLSKLSYLFGVTRSEWQQAAESLPADAAPTPAPEPATAPAKPSP